MKQIQLTQNLFALINDEDFEDITQFKWYATSVGSRTYYASRGVWLGNKEQSVEYMHHRILPLLPGFEIDHIDGNGLNNQRHNLRLVTKRQNAQNKHHIKKTSVYPGVLWHKYKKRWRAQIRIEGKTKYLGHYKEEIDAFNAYCDALKKIGETLV